VSQTTSVVLLVEGDIVVRHPLAEYLRSCGFLVYEAATGDEAKQYLNSAAVDVDFILADMTTTGSGFALRKWVMEQGLRAEVILAGSTEKAVAQAGDLCNEGPALAKPWDHRLVLEHIKQVIARRARDGQ
jgi:DNA-binding response OmpR family regulator